MNHRWTFDSRPLSYAARPPFSGMNKVEASVARCLRTPPAGAYPGRTLSIGITNRLRGLRYRSIVVVGNYGLVHHGGTIPGKSTSFTPSSILFRPRRCSAQVRPFGRTDPTEMGCVTHALHRWSRRVLPPGPIGLLRRPFIAIAGPCGTAGAI